MNVYAEKRLFGKWKTGGFRVAFVRMEFWLLTLRLHNDVENGRIRTKEAPIDSPHSKLSIETKFVLIWPLPTKLCTLKVNNDPSDPDR